MQHFARLFMIPTMYPKRARYTGSGSIDDAASFVAADPATPPDDHVKWLGSDLMRPGGGRR